MKETTGWIGDLFGLELRMIFREKPRKLETEKGFIMVPGWVIGATGRVPNWQECRALSPGARVKFVI